MTAYVKDQYYPEFKRKEGCHASLDENGLTMLLLYSDPTNEEISNVCSGVQARFGILKKEGVIFFLAKFGSSPWIDFPYSPHIGKPFEIPNIPDGQGLALTVILADCNTGKVKAIRLIGLPNGFSKTIMSLVYDAQNTPFDARKYDYSLTKIYRLFSTGQLVKMAEDTCKIN